MKSVSKKPTTPAKNTGRKTESKEKRNGFFDFAHNTHLDEYIGPWVFFLLVCPGISLIGRKVWADSSLVDAVLIIIAGVLAAAVWSESHRRGIYVRIRITLTAAWPLFVIVGTSAWGGLGPVTIDRPWGDVLFGAGSLIAFWWSLAAHEALQPGEPPDKLAEALSLGDTQPDGVTDDGLRRVVELKLKDVTLAALQSARGLIAVKAGVPANAVLVTPGKTADKASLSISRRDVLATPQDWPGPSRPGKSIMEPVRQGWREDTSYLEARLMGHHTIAGGITGAGKTEGTLVEVAETFTRRDCITIWGDPVKAGQTLHDIAPACAFVATTKEECRQLIVGLTKLIPFLSQNIGARSWSDKCWYPAILIYVDESAWFAESADEELLEAVATARSVGIHIQLAFQRPDGATVNTSIRAQFAEGWCFGLRDARDAGMVLGENAIANGAMPELWRDDHPGYCYRECGPSALHAMAARTYFLDPDRLAAHTAEWAPKQPAIPAQIKAIMHREWPGLKTGPEYALAHGWTQTDGLWIPPARGTRPSDDTPEDRPAAREQISIADGPGSSISTPDDTEDDDMLTTNRLRREARESVRADIDRSMDPDPEADAILAEALAHGTAGIDPNAQGRADGDFTLGINAHPDAPPLSRVERVRALADVLDALLDGRDQAVTTTERLRNAWLDVKGITVAQRPAMYELLGLAEKAGCVVHERRGRWQITAGAVTWLQSHAEELSGGADVG